MAKEGSVAPKERINVKFIPATGDQKAEIELPLRMLVTGDFKGGRDATDPRLEERAVVSVDKNTFNTVMKNANLKLDINVDDRLSENPPEGATLPVSINVEGLSDFEPDSIARKVPELNNLLELRDALVALKGPLGSLPKFRQKLKDLLKDQHSRETLEKEINELLKAKDEAE